MHKLCVAAVVASFVFVAFAQKDYYVNPDPSSVPGYDPSAEAGSAKNPDSTIAAAIAHCGEGYYGDVIHVANGTYHLGGTPLKVPAQTTLRGESRDGVIIDGDGLSCCVNSFYPTNYSNVHLENLTFKNDYRESAEDLDGGTVYMYHGTISNCVFRGCVINVTADSKTVKGGVVCGTNGLTMYDSIIEDCICSNVWTSGTIFGGILNGVTGVRCTVRNNMSVGGRTDGFNNYDGGVAKEGGGWTDSAFIGNRAVSTTGKANCRGSVLAYPGDVTGCFFVSNSVCGRGVVCVNYSKAISNCSFIGTYAEPTLNGNPSGPALMIEGSGNVVENCWFEDNRTSGGNQGEQGAVCINIRATGPRVRNCVFYHNELGVGRNLVNPGNATTGLDHHALSNCVFEANYIKKGRTDTCYLIGAFGNEGRELKLTDIVMRGNVQNDGKLEAFYTGSGYNVQLQNAVVVSNELDYAVDFHLWDSKYNAENGAYHNGDPDFYEAFISNCTIADNKFTRQAVNFYAYGGNTFDCFLRNVALWGNSNVSGSSYANSTFSAGYDAFDSFINYCAIDSRVTETANLGKASMHNVITSDMKFKDAAAGDYTLRHGSPLVNAGTDLAWMSGRTDMTGITYDHDPAKPGVRVYSTAKKHPRVSGSVDIGAYEYMPKPGFVIMYR